MTQTLAIFLDAYRELNSRKLFWITLAISGFVVSGSAALGINERGISFLFWTMPTQVVNTSVVTVETFYKTLFSGFGVEVWLAKGATILALISTASIFPDMLARGSVDLVLSKPISRLKLFLLKYLAGLLFVALQVFIFCVASFLVIGLRAGVWEPAIFVALPLVVCFFSYLFAFCALLGVWMRSVIAVIIWTILIWITLFGTYATETWLLAERLESEMRIEVISREIQARDAQIERLSGSAGTGVDSHNQRGASARALERLEDAQNVRRGELAAVRDTLAKQRRTHRAAFVAVTLLPKPAETVALMERALVELADLPEVSSIEERLPGIAGMGMDGPIELRRGDVTQRLIEVTRQRSVWWIIGSSLLSELVILGFGAWVFSRRDF